MSRSMTTIYLSEQQMTKLRKRVLEVKAEVPNLTNSTVIRFGLDLILNNWEQHQEAIIKAGQQETKRKYRN